MKDVSDAFDREYDQSDYEKKIRRLIECFDKRVRNENPAEYDEWHAAIHFLRPKDHYRISRICLSGCGWPRSPA